MGALFLLVGVAEVIPSVFKLGSNEMRVGRTVAQQYILRKAEQAQAIAATGDTETAMRVLETVANPPAPELTLSQSSDPYLPLRDEVINYLTAWVKGSQAHLAHTNSLYSVIIEMNGRVIAIDMAGLEFGPAQLFMMGTGIPDEIRPLHAIVSLLRRSLWTKMDSLRDIWGTLHAKYNVPVYTVLWGGQSRFDRLIKAIEQLASREPGAEPGRPN